MIDLMKFVAEPNDWRKRLSTPWSLGEYSYATNGHIGVRVPRREDVPERPDAPDFPRILASVKPSLMQVPVPSFEAPPFKKPCPDCNGFGIMAPCANCDGKGEIECHSCGHENECEKCHGSGEAKLTSQEAADRLRGTNPPPHICECCGGERTVEDTSPMVRLTDCLFVAPRYLVLIRELPNARIDLAHDGTSSPMWFTFDGGDGVLMPMRCSDPVKDADKIIDVRVVKEAAE